jgi:hypothetical protein
LGFDRNYNRYWFFRGYPGIFVEQGRRHEYIRSCLVYFSFFARLLDYLSSDSQWFIYDSQLSIEQLVRSLNERGIREYHLGKNLKKSMSLIDDEFQQSNKPNVTYDTFDSLARFRIELEEFEERLRLGSLGGFHSIKSLHCWQQHVQDANDYEQLAQLLVELQETVPDKSLTDLFTSNDKQLVHMWTNDCRLCRTYSRLHVLLIVFDHAITWKKSIIGMKCRLCRKKTRDEFMLVCDRCSHGYHYECLPTSDRRRKAMSIDEQWFCSTCRQQTNSHVNVNHRQVKKSSNDKQDRCCICGHDQQLISCSQCQQHYHCQCHQPILRCRPRSTTWTCSRCHPILNTLRSRSRTTIDHSSSKIQQYVCYS